MDKFQKLILSNGIDSITIEPIVKGIKHKGYSISEHGIAYHKRGGISPATIETQFDEDMQVENFINNKQKEGFKIIEML